MRRRHSRWLLLISSSLTMTGPDIPPDRRRDQQGEIPAVAFAQASPATLPSDFNRGFQATPAIRDLEVFNVAPVIDGYFTSGFLRQQGGCSQC